MQSHHRYEHKAWEGSYSERGRLPGSINADPAGCETSCVKEIGREWFGLTSNVDNGIKALSLCGTIVD